MNRRKMVQNKVRYLKDVGVVGGRVMSQFKGHNVVKVLQVVVNREKISNIFLYRGSGVYCFSNKYINKNVPYATTRSDESFVKCLISVLIPKPVRREYKDA